MGSAASTEEINTEQVYVYLMKNPAKLTALQKEASATSESITMPGIDKFEQLTDEEVWALAALQKRVLANRAPPKPEPEPELEEDFHYRKTRYALMHMATAHPTYMVRKAISINMKGDLVGMPDGTWRKGLTTLAMSRATAKAKSIEIRQFSQEKGESDPDEPLQSHLDHNVVEPAQRVYLFRHGTLESTSNNISLILAASIHTGKNENAIKNKAKQLEGQVQKQLYETGKSCVDRMYDKAGGIECWDDLHPAELMGLFRTVWSYHCIHLIFGLTFSRFLI